MTIGSAVQLHTGIRSAAGVYRPTWYITSLPGHNHDGSRCIGTERNSDWGWTAKREQAIDLSPYWQRRFLADQRRCNREGTLEIVAAR